MQQENLQSIAKDKGCLTLEEGGQRGKKLQEAAVLQTRMYKISRAEASLLLQGREQ